jgi:dethiobiotin synthetase
MKSEGHQKGMPESGSTTKPVSVNQSVAICVVAGIDSGVGKTMATGLLARWFKDTDNPAITMKMVQTGGSGLSEDVVAHRRLASTEMAEEDAMGLTCPYVFSVSCAPHLAAQLDGRTLDPQVIVNAAEELAGVYGHVLVEAVGGLFTPLTEDLSVVDLIQAQNWPVLLVTGPWAGSVNHTLAALETLERRGITLQGMIYNLDGSRTLDPRIIDDSRRLFGRAIKNLGCRRPICDIPDVSCTKTYCVDFSGLFS